ncbi:MAG: formate dehydrogenase subunit gamma [Yoonia sp.]|jgi:formate dehydrogenase subunit gamma
MTMKSFTTQITAVFGLVAMLAFAAVPMGRAQQVNPTAEAVSEDSLFQQLEDGQMIDGRVSIPDAKAAGLIKPDNKGWAATYTGSVKFLSIAAIVSAVGVLALFYIIRGRIRIDGGLSGIRILRFSAFERFSHWLMAGSFMILAITGLNVVLGRTIILPWLGESAFSTMTTWGKISHNYVGWAFMLGLIFSFVVWVVHNIPDKVDVQWMAQGGGLLKKGVHPPAKKFNAGQKMIFWSVTLGGSALCFTGVMMLFPAIAGAESDWQFYQLIHGIAAAGLSFIIIAHIYIGSVGMEGAFDAMANGEVDLNWAKEHHSLWVEEMQGDAAHKQPATKSSQPAE